MKKRITALLLAALISVGMTACGSTGSNEEASSADSTSTAQSGDNVSDNSTVTEIQTLSTEEIKAQIKSEAEKNEGTVKIKLWAPENSIDLYKEKLKEFSELYGDPSYTLDLGALITDGSKGAHKMVENYEHTAEIITVSANDIPRLIQKNYITEPDKAYSVNSTDIFTDEAVQAVTIDGRQYAYPMSYTPTCIVYDKQVYTDPADIASLDSLIAKANENGKKFYFNIENEWNTISFLLTTGTPLSFSDGQQVFGCKTDEAFSAFKSIRDYSKLIGSGFETDVSYKGDVSIGDEFAGYIAFFNDIKLPLSENTGIAKLPTIMVNGEQKQLETLGDLWCMVIKKDTQFPKTAQALAAFLSSSEILKDVREKVDASVPLKEFAESEILTAIKEEFPYMHVQNETVGAVFWGIGTSGFVSKITRERGQISDERLQNGINTGLIVETGMKQNDW